MLYAECNYIQEHGCWTAFKLALEKIPKTGTPSRGRHLCVTIVCKCALQKIKKRKISSFQVQTMLLSLATRPEPVLLWFLQNAVDMHQSQWPRDHGICKIMKASKTQSSLAMGKTEDPNLVRVPSSKCGISCPGHEVTWRPGCCTGLWRARQPRSSASCLHCRCWQGWRCWALSWPV